MSRRLCPHGPGGTVTHPGAPWDRWAEPQGRQQAGASAKRLGPRGRSVKPLHAGGASASLFPHTLLPRSRHRVQVSSSSSSTSRTAPSVPLPRVCHRSSISQGPGEDGVESEPRETPEARCLLIECHRQSIPSQGFVFSEGKNSLSLMGFLLYGHRQPQRPKKSVSLTAKTVSDPPAGSSVFGSAPLRAASPRRVGSASGRHLTHQRPNVREQLSHGLASAVHGAATRVRRVFRLGWMFT